MDGDPSCMTEEEQVALALRESLASSKQENQTELAPERKSDHYDYERKTEEEELARVLQESLNDKGKYQS